MPDIVKPIEVAILAEYFGLMHNLPPEAQAISLVDALCTLGSNGRVSRSATSRSTGSLHAKRRYPTDACFRRFRR